MSDVTVGVAGATGALGKEILAVLERAPWRPAQVVALASAASKIPFVEWGEHRLAVDDLAGADLAELDLLLLAVPAGAAEPAIREALDADVLVVDCSAARADDPDAPPVLPWVNPQVLAPGPFMVRVPSAPASLIASALGPLARAGGSGPVEATVFLPASHWGRDGIEELSRQVVAMFNSATPPRKVFEGGLAFDLIPQTGPLQDGWTALEHRIAQDALLVSGWQGPLKVTAVGVPVFSGISAEVRVRSQRHIPAELAHQILIDGGMKGSDGEGPRAVPRPRRVEGQPFPRVDRLRVDDGTLYLWAAADNLRMSAAIAVASAGAMIRMRSGQHDD